MSKPLQIYFIRHGETTWSLYGQHTGRTDIPLTPRGEVMARELETTLRGIPFSKVLTSPRLRARATCTLAGLDGSGDEAASVEANLAEWDYGDYEGLHTREIQERSPHWDIWTDGCPGGETPADISKRTDTVIAQLNGLTGRVALFSHGQFGRALAARWIGLPLAAGRHFSIDPASISILSFEADRPQRRVISLWNASSNGQLRPA